VRLVQLLLAEFETLYSEFLVSGCDILREKWKRLSNIIGCRVKVSDEKEEMEGEALDIDKEGFLLIRKENGNVKRILSGDVSLINSN
jgi:BirA family biotin operon repressor/biotin-[acetyl-CoA-carboxylase] ligase